MHTNKAVQCSCELRICEHVSMYVCRFFLSNLNTRLHMEKWVTLYGHAYVQCVTFHGECHTEWLDMDMDMDIGTTLEWLKEKIIPKLQGNRCNFIWRCECCWVCKCACVCVGVSTQIHRIFKLKALYFKSLSLHLHVFIVVLLFEYNFYPIHSCIPCIRKCIV